MISETWVPATDVSKPIWVLDSYFSLVILGCGRHLGKRTSGVGDLSLCFSNKLKTGKRGVAFLHWKWTQIYMLYNMHLLNTSYVKRSNEVQYWGRHRPCPRKLGAGTAWEHKLTQPTQHPHKVMPHKPRRGFQKRKWATFEEGICKPQEMRGREWRGLLLGNNMQSQRYRKLSI